MPTLKSMASYAGSLVALGTVAVAIGYGWPWTTSAEGKTLLNDIQTLVQHEGATDQTLYELKRRDCQRDRADAQDELANAPNSRSAKNDLADAQDCIDTYTKLIVRSGAQVP